MTEDNDCKQSKIVFRILCAVCVAIAVLVFGGIYDDYHEIEQIDLLQVLGIDHDGGEIVLTALGSQKSGDSPILYTGKGEAMNRAAANMQTEAGAEYLHFGHVKYIILSKNASKEKISDVLDYCIRMPDIGLNAALFYVEATARESMENVEQDKDLSKILESMSNKGKETSLMYNYTLIDVISSLKREGFALVSAFGVENQQVIPVGTAVLQEKGETIMLDKQETSILALLDKRLRSYSLVVEGAGGKGVGIDMSEAKVDYKAESMDNKWKINITIHLTCGLDELYSEQEMLDRQGIIEIEDAVETKVKGQVDTLIEKSFSLGIDYCYLGQRAYLILGNLEARKLENLEYSVVVEADINRTYAIGEGAEDE